MIKLGLVGLGKMGISHLAISNSHPLISSISICDKSKLVLNGLKRNSKFNIYSNYKKLISEENLDAIIIATPTEFHFENAKFALENDIHTFLEKPMCENIGDSVFLNNLASEKKIVNQIGYVNRFNNVFQHAKYILDKGILGNLIRFEAEMFGNVVLKRQSSSWRSKNKKTGGCLFEYGSHSIDLLLYFLGKPEKIRDYSLKKIFSTDNEDAAYIVFEYKDNLDGILSINWSEPSYRKASNIVKFYGDQGKMYIDKQEIKIFLIDKPKEKDLNKGWNIIYNTDLNKSVFYYLRGEDYSEQLAYFFMKVNSLDINNINSFSSALETEKILHKIKDG